MSNYAENVQGCSQDLPRVFTHESSHDDSCATEELLGSEIFLFLVTVDISDCSTGTD